MDAERAFGLLREISICVLATSTLGGKPWASPVFYNFDGSGRLVWESAKDAWHSRLIRENPRIGIVVANTDPDASDDAVYLECLASEVPSDRLEDALEVFVNGPHRQRAASPTAWRTTAAISPLASTSPSRSMPTCRWSRVTRRDAGSTAARKST